MQWEAPGDTRSCDLTLADDAIALDNLKQRARIVARLPVGKRWKIQAGVYEFAQPKIVHGKGMANP